MCVIYINLVYPIEIIEVVYEGLCLHPPLLYFFSSYFRVPPSPWIYIPKAQIFRQIGVKHPSLPLFVCKILRRYPKPRVAPINHRH